MKTTLQQEIDELERELRVRKKVYPDWIKLGKIHKNTAQSRIDTLQNCIDRLKQIQVKKEHQTSIF